MGRVLMPSKKEGRINMRADQAWIDEVEAEVQSFGLSISAYLRLATNEKMQRDRAARSRCQPSKKRDTPTRAEETE